MAKEQCRICLNKGPVISIFCQRDSLLISARIMSLAKVQIYPEDGLPSTICRKCVKKFDLCLEFIQLCRSSDSKLRALLQNNVKETDNNINLQNYIDEDLSKYSPNSDSVKDLVVDESTNQSYMNENDFIKKETELTDSRDDCDKIKIKNESKTDKQQCFTCGKVMSSRFRLKTHLRTHTGERPFSCPHCTKTFSLAQNLKVHLRIHTGEKPLTCTECGEKFAHSAGLAAHKRKHTGQTPYRCVLCPRSFRTVGHLQYHIRRHTGEKNFECDTCSRAFITRSDLKQHLLSHSGVKPHVCSICGLRLTRASHLKRHVQFIHSGEHFACLMCSSKFMQKAELEKHMKKHENVDKT